MTTVTILPDQLDVAVDELRQGEVVAFPTETVYGLGALYDSERGIEKIFSLKNRPRDNPLIVHISDWNMLALLVSDIPEMAVLLAATFWPGPLTMILPKHRALSPLITAGQPGVAVRMPRNPVAAELVRKCKKPLVAPSANLSGRPSSTSAEHVREDFEGRLSLIIDGGECEEGIESTVVNLLDPQHIQILRPGNISAEEIEKVIKRPLSSASFPSQGLSPGMRYRHYAPQARILLIKEWNEVEKYRGAPDTQILVPEGSSKEFENYSSKTLFALFRKADRLGKTQLVIYVPHEIQSHAGLWNRLQKAAAAI